MRYSTMQVRYKGKTEFLILTHDKVYTVLDIENGWYRLVDDSGDDYLYAPITLKLLKVRHADNDAIIKP